MMFHYFGFHYVTCPQPLDLPCACGTFKKPMSSIGSKGSLVLLSSQAFARSRIVGNTASALTVLKAFLNSFENVVNQRVDIQEDIKRYQNTLSYASSKIDHSIGESIYMLPSDMNLNIKLGTVGYNNKMLASNGMFSLGKMIRSIL